MFERSKQSAAVLILLLAVVLLVGGCGSGSDETTTTVSGVTPTVPTNPSAGGGSDLLGTQLKTTADTPAEYVEAMNQAQPVILLFYVPGGVDDLKVLQNLSALQPQFPNYRFLIYDYSIPDAYGDLSSLLAVNYPPELVLVDGTGTIREIWNGFVDEGTLNQSLVNLGA